jgi:pimeloyl-[acyl-carrier protein] synthase
MNARPAGSQTDPGLSLFSLLDPEVLANPYPLYRRLREEAPVHWDQFLHAWVVTRYEDVLKVLLTFSADRTPTTEQLRAMDMERVTPIAAVMVKQMLFLDPPDHTRLRSICAHAFTPDRVKVLRHKIQAIASDLLNKALQRGEIDFIADFAEPLPAIVAAEMLGVPVEDHLQLKDWSAAFAEMLGNFQHNPDRIQRVLHHTHEMVAYFKAKIRDQKEHPRDGLINALVNAEVDGERLTEDDIVANVIVTMVGGQETTTNLLGNGILTLLRNSSELIRLRSDLSLIPSAIEELLRYESPSQQTGRIAPDNLTMGGYDIKKGQAVIAVMAAGNRDPERFPEPDRLDLGRQDNRHLAFGWGSHFCFGAPLARLEGQVALDTILRHVAHLELTPEPLVWRENLGLRGLKAMPLKLQASFATTN